APGQPLALTWRTSGGTKLTLSRAGVAMPLLTETDAARIAAGSFTDTVPANLPVDGVLAYTLQLESGGTMISAAAAARVAGGLKLSQLNVPEYVRPGRPYGVSWQTAGASSLE